MKPLSSRGFTLINILHYLFFDESENCGNEIPFLSGFSTNKKHPRFGLDQSEAAGTKFVYLGVLHQFTRSMIFLTSQKTARAWSLFHLVAKSLQRPPSRRTTPRDTRSFSDRPWYPSGGRERLLWNRQRNF